MTRDTNGALPRSSVAVGLRDRGESMSKDEIERLKAETARKKREIAFLENYARNSAADPEMDDEGLGTMAYWEARDTARELDTLQDRIQQLQQQAELLLQAVIIPGERTHEGQLVLDVRIAWFEIVARLVKEPRLMHELDWRKWEEIICGAYWRAGYRRVTLTPPSGDFGRDFIAEHPAMGAIRIVGQMKAYKPGHKVTADSVRALVGVMLADPKATKGMVMTTSDFAPRIAQDILLRPLMPDRLELMNGVQLLKWLQAVRG